MEAFVDDEYGMRVRKQFKNIGGWSEKAMLQAPSRAEFEQLKRAVAIMTPCEKESVAELMDEQVMKIAEDAGIDKGLFAIFVNGFVLEKSQIHKGTKEQS